MDGFYSYLTVESALLRLIRLLLYNLWNLNTQI